jgi:hypothetical protein
VGHGWHGLTDIDHLSYEIDRPLPRLPDANTRTPCTAHPERYDDNAPFKIQKQAAKACRACPALDACRALLTSLPEPRGVIAGAIIRRPEHTQKGEPSTITRPRR